MRAGKNQQLHLMAEEIRQRIESLRKENHQQRQWLDVRIALSWSKFGDNNGLPIISKLLPSPAESPPPPSPPKNFTDCKHIPSIPNVPSPSQE